jgi:hypothetical protein
MTISTEVVSSCDSNVAMTHHQFSKNHALIGFLLLPEGFMDIVKVHKKALLG